MARRSAARRLTLAQRLNRKPKTRTLNRKTERKADRLKRVQAESLKQQVRKGVSKVRQAVTSSGKKTTVIRGPKHVESSWVESIAYVRHGNRNGVAVRFLDGVDVFYPFTSLKDYEYLRDAASKGKAIHRRFFDLPYELM